VTTPLFEQGPIRPPSEASSLLVRVVRNCGWNRCRFCPVYKDARPSVRAVDDVLADVAAMRAAADVLGGDPLTALRSGAVPREAWQVALFLRAGARAVFLQDADPCAVKAESLATVIERVRAAFATVERVTTYGRAATLARRRPADLARLAAAGLSRVHVGMESGSDAVLARVDKGCSAEQLVTAGRQVLAAGMELCFYVMPGLGGRPLVVRLRTTAVVPGTPLACDEVEGRFALPDDVEVAAELRALLGTLDGVRLDLRSDHALNLMAGLEGSLPADREELIGLLDAFLALPAARQAEIAWSARRGVVGELRGSGDPSLTGAGDEPATSLDQVTERLAAAKRLRARFL
jgi:hypothetical protein